MLLRQATYFRPFLDAAVVLGVDDRLLAVVGPRMRAGRAERDVLRAGKREQAPATLALACQRVLQVGAGAGDDLDLRRDQLAGDVLVQQRIARRGRLAHLLEARHEFERVRIQDRELLLHTDREVGRARRTSLPRGLGPGWSWRSAIWCESGWGVWRSPAGRQTMIDVQVE